LELTRSQARSVEHMPRGLIASCAAETPTMPRHADKTAE
jgi:hypothetical protein